jgi:hypothetical protein
MRIRAPALSYGDRVRQLRLRSADFEFEVALDPVGHSDPAGLVVGARAMAGQSPTVPDLVEDVDCVVGLMVEVDRDHRGGPRSEGGYVDAAYVHSLSWERVRGASRHPGDCTALAMSRCSPGHRRVGAEKNAQSHQKCHRQDKPSLHAGNDIRHGG